MNQACQNTEKVGFWVAGAITEVGNQIAQKRREEHTRHPDQALLEIQNTLKSVQARLNSRQIRQACIGR